MNEQGFGACCGNLRLRQVVALGLPVLRVPPPKRGGWRGSRTVSGEVRMSFPGNNGPIHRPPMGGFLIRATEQ